MRASGDEDHGALRTMNGKGSEPAAARSALYPERLVVVVPCRNCAAYIGECLDSLRAQTFGGWSALVADDASTDETPDIVRDFMRLDSRIDLRRGEERAFLMGNTLAALRSLDLRPSDVVAILDGDDWIRPTCLEKIWERHCQGYDLVYTDEDVQGGHSVGAALSFGVPVRRQSWRFSQLRSFKAHLFGLLDDETFRDPGGGYFRAAGDLALYLPMAELAGPDKVSFIPEKLYYYRVHENCNFKVLRQEQLDNNWYIRSRPALMRQAEFFDFTERVERLEKPRIADVARAVRERYPRPCSVRIEHVIAADEVDSWRAYHELWVEDGVYLAGTVRGEGEQL